MVSENEKSYSNVDVEQLNEFVDEFNRLVRMLKMWEPILNAIANATGRKTGVYIVPSIGKVAIVNHVEEIPDWWVHNG